VIRPDTLVDNSAFHILVVGRDYSQLGGLFDRIAHRSGFRFSHILHPRCVAASRPDSPPRGDVHFLRSTLSEPMPEADRPALARLEGEGIPSVHNMILGDPIVSKIDYEQALGFATFLLNRFAWLYQSLEPSVIVGSFDGLHSAIAFAVAKKLGIPWVALNFSVIPQGLACFCAALTPDSRIQLSPLPGEAGADAAEYLRRFEHRDIKAYAYIAPRPQSISGQLAALPRRLGAVVKTLKNSRLHSQLQLAESRNLYSLPAVLHFLRRGAHARRAIASFPTRTSPPPQPYVLFGLHLQPESSIDVWAPFFSNQPWVIELIARAIPPTHKLLVKIHKSDVSNYTRAQLVEMCSWPGVEIVAPFADMRSFIERAQLLISIQGTMGLEGALLGKQVITLGESPLVLFPNVSPVGRITDLPRLIREKLVAAPPNREEIVAAYAAYLAPFQPASHNDWTVRVTDQEIAAYGNLFVALRGFLMRRQRQSS
jgi:hypothetical protein